MPRAYVQGRRMECRRMIAEYDDPKLTFWAKVKNTWNICTNYLSDLLFSYGESMIKMILAYIFTVFLFALFFKAQLTPLEYFE